MRTLRICPRNNFLVYQPAVKHLIYWTKTLNKVFKYNQSGKKKKQKTNVSKEQKKNKRSHQIKNTYKEMEIIKNNTCHNNAISLLQGIYKVVVENHLIVTCTYVAQTVQNPLSRQET